MRVSVLRIVPEHRKDGRASLPVRPSRAAPVARKSDALLRRGTIVLLLILGILCGSSGPSRRNRGTLATFAAARSQISRNLWLDFCVDWSWWLVPPPRFGATRRFDCSMLCFLRCSLSFESVSPSLPSRHSSSPLASRSSFWSGLLQGRVLSTSSLLCVTARYCMLLLAAAHRRSSSARW